jgi:ABC-type lipoprotein export system ATPase subunit
MEPERFYIATTASRGDPVELTLDERARHVYIVGKTGSGKSTLVYHLAMLDILAGHGVAVIDPHGDLAEAVADSIPRHRINETCYLVAKCTTRPSAVNLFSSQSRSM